MKYLHTMIMRHKLLLVLLAIFGTVMPSMAQSTIDMSMIDMSAFFEWFNIMLGVLWPIFAIGAGLQAATLFIPKVFNWFTNAFR